MSNLLTVLQEHQTVMSQLESMLPLIEKAAAQILAALDKGGKVFFMGNGGSAADAQHLAAEFIGRFTQERPALAALALNTDTSVLTCLSNDHDYSIIFSRQLEALCQPQDVVVGISTSGTSKNIVKGIETAKKRGAYTLALTGRSGGKMRDLADLCFCVPSDTVARIQEAHIFIGHSLCEWVEDSVVARKAKCTSQAELHSSIV
jgi:D-sedoheptulose 7-phosphate isomerase